MLQQQAAKCMLLSVYSDKQRVRYAQQQSNKITNLLKKTMNTYPNNTDELRQIPIVSYLEHQGYRPAKPENSRGEVKFLSPFRSETKPSFSVNVVKNVWHDYGSGEGGSIFDLVMKLWNVDFIKAKEILGKGTYKQMFYRPSDTHYERLRPSPFTDIRASPLTSTYFLDYCKERCIDLEVAKEECRQVDFRLSGHMNSAIGFENDKGGWEFRSPTTKICTCKAISTRRKQDGNTTVCVFEGFFDYLSFLTMMKAESRSKFDYVVLNSVSSASKSISILRGYRKVLCYLDNDQAGKNSFDIIRKEIDAENRSEKILPFNDVNEYLCKGLNPTTSEQDV